MVKSYKLHKLAGLSAGFILLLLGLTGFLLDHDKWSFLYTTTFKHLPEASKKIDNKLFDTYWVDDTNNAHRIIGGKRGIFESFDSSQSFLKISSLQCLAIKSDARGVYAATSDGIYKIQDSKLELLSLEGEYITSLSLSQDKIVAVIDKHLLVTIQKDNVNQLSKHIVEIEASKLNESIKLSRFVRDIHYGRGLFDGDISLLINDYGAIVISLLALSGYVIYWLIRKKRDAHLSRKLIRFHASWFSIVALFPLVLLAITGVFLDHSKALAKFMSSVTIPNTILPPVYTSLTHDIWSVDFDGKVYRIGNRHGIYKSEDLKSWELENKGLAYKMIRKNETLYVSGMGAPNRAYEKEWKVLPQTPHMFKDVMSVDGNIEYFSSHKSTLNLPTFEDVTLYALVLSIHDGTFFSSWWVWINDYAAFALLILGMTGVYRWRKKRKKA